MSYRPETPIPIDCSFTLLACKLQVHNKKYESTLTKNKSQKNMINHPNQQRKWKQRTSLKYAKQSKVIENIHVKSNIQVDGLNNYQDSVDYFSSAKEYMLEPNKNKGNQTMRLTLPSHLNPPTIQHLSSAQKSQKVSINSPPPKTYPHTNFFTDQITLNHNPSGIYQWKDRETTNTNTKINFINSPSPVYIKRRVMTEQNASDQKNQSPNTPNNRCSSPLAIAYRSQLANSINKLQFEQLQKCSIPFSQKYVSMKKTQSLQNQPQKNQYFFHLKESYPITTQISKNNYHTNNSSKGFHVRTQVQPGTQTKMPTQFKQVTLDNHIRKQSSPRFLKKFNTLTELNCKCAQSNGDMSSFNKGSILMSDQQSVINESISDLKLMGNFNRIIKFMNPKGTT